MQHIPMMMGIASHFADCAFRFPSWEWIGFLVVDSRAAAMQWIAVWYPKDCSVDILFMSCRMVNHHRIPMLGLRTPDAQFWIEIYEAEAIVVQTIVRSEWCFYSVSVSSFSSLLLSICTAAVQCSQRDSAFSKKNNLTIHIRAVHRKEKRSLEMSHRHSRHRNVMTKFFSDTLNQHSFANERERNPLSCVTIM